MFKLTKRARDLALAASLILCTSAALAQSPMRLGELTAHTAPDATSRAILAHPIDRLYGAGTKPTPDMMADAIHASFPQIIEQNFARLDKMQMEALVNGLSEAELSDLAQLYVNATTDSGASPRLLKVMAHRMSPAHLGRISRHFGFARVYDAVTSEAPGKSNDFIAKSHPDFAGAVPGERRFGPAGRFAPQQQDRSMMRTVFRPDFDNDVDDMLALGMVKTAGGGLGQFLNYTPYEIYLSFRTAPVGALGVTGALWESSIVLGGGLALAYGGGYSVGEHIVAPLIQTYAPNLWISIGDNIGGIVQSISNAFTSGSTANMAHAEAATAPQFQCTSMQQYDFSHYSGDYGVSSEWTSIGYSIGGSCGGKPCVLPR